MYSKPLEISTPSDGALVTGTVSFAGTVSDVGTGVASVEVSLDGGEVFQRHFQRPSFAEFWAEARVILQTLTDIELITDFRCPEVPDREALLQKTRACLDEAITEANLMYEQGMFEQYLMQFGANCAGLPADVEERLQQARRQLGQQA